MFYKPNYCCNCGEKIERIEWNLFTNRRFCEVCESEHQLDDWLKRVFPTIFLLIGIFGIGSYFQATKSSVVVTSKDKKVVLPSSSKKEIARPRTFKSSNRETVGTINEQSASETDASASQKKESKALALKEHRQPKERIRKVVKAKSPLKDANGTIYFCGAQTKKGTPCSRKVKGGGRCWQHEGREAILPEKELFVESK